MITEFVWRTGFRSSYSVRVNPPWRSIESNIDNYDIHKYFRIYMEFEFCVHLQSLDKNFQNSCCHFRVCRKAQNRLCVAA